MSYYAKSGVQLDPKTFNSTKFFYLTTGNILDTETGMVYVVHPKQFERKPGVNYVYFEREYETRLLYHIIDLLSTH